MSEHANVAAVRNVLDAFLTGDLDRILGAYTEDAVYRVAGDNIVSGDFKGHDQIRDFFIHLATVTDEWKVEVDDVLADDNHAALVINFTTRRGERTLEATAAMAFKVAPDGRFTESWFLYNDQAAYDDFYRE